MSYTLLGLHSFFTVGEDEVRAWTIPVGAQRRRGGRHDPHRPGARLHPRRGGQLRRAGRRGRPHRRAAEGAVAAGRQGVRRAKRGYPQHPVSTSDCANRLKGDSRCVVYSPLLSVLADRPAGARRVRRWRQARTHRGPGCGQARGRHAGAGPGGVQADRGGQPAATQAPKPTAATQAAADEALPVLKAGRAEKLRRQDGNQVRGRQTRSGPRSLERDGDDLSSRSCADRL